jgi:uncharacterized protein
MNSLNETLDRYFQILEQYGSLAPKAIIGLNSIEDWVAMKFPEEITPFEDLKTYFLRVNGYSNNGWREGKICRPDLAWGMRALSLDECLRHHETALFIYDDENPYYWPLEFLPIMWDGAGSYVVVNCDTSSPKYGAVYDMCDGVGCNRISNSLQEFFEASAQEVLLGLRTYSRDLSQIAVRPDEYLSRAATLFGNSPYFILVGRMSNQIVDWKVNVDMITLRPFPTASRMRWRRMDAPGHEEAHIERTTSGWRLTGELDIEEADLAARLHYTIECDQEWRTRSAVIDGEADGNSIRFELAADGVGNWSRDGAPAPDLSGALHVDLGFTPATNMFPIRRLALAVGESAPVRSVWLRIPELRLEPLEQTYIRDSELTYIYRAIVKGSPFIMDLDTDEFGRVIRYGGLWEAESAEPNGEQTDQEPTT